MVRNSPREPPLQDSGRAASWMGGSGATAIRPRVGVGSVTARVHRGHKRYPEPRDGFLYAGGDGEGRAIDREWPVASRDFDLDLPLTTGHDSLNPARAARAGSSAWLWPSRSYSPWRPAWASWRPRRCRSRRPGSGRPHWPYPRHWRCDLGSLAP